MQLPRRRTPANSISPGTATAPACTSTAIACSTPTASRSTAAARTCTTRARATPARPRQPDPDGLERWSDELLDNWGANFIRFDLEAYADDAGYRVQWKTLTDDPDYLSDILEVVSHMTAKPGVYVMVTLFIDPSIKDNNGDFDSEWPTASIASRATKRWPKPSMTTATCCSG